MIHKTSVLSIDLSNGKLIEGSHELRGVVTSIVIVERDPLVDKIKNGKNSDFVISGSKNQSYT